MSMHIELPYGKGVLPVHLDVDADIISGRECPPLDMAEDKILDALRSPIGCRPLRDLVSPQSSVVIVHTDITRPTPNHIILPVILKELIDAGATRENISLLNATGSHRGQSMDELAAMLGEDTVRDYRIIQHDAFNPGELVFTGRTASGNDIYLNREYVGADLRIVTGFIEPHFFAGFSGGPKALLPGIAGIGSIMANHCAVNIGNPDAVWGKTIGNPVWEEIARAATFAPPHFCLNVSLDIDKRITGIFAGELSAAHEAGCAFVGEHSMARVNGLYDIVLTTNSGYPLDQNLYQAVKGLSAAAGITKKGGAIIMAARCGEGMPEHGNFRRILEAHPDPQSLLSSLGPETVPDQWQAQILARILLHCDVYMYSDGLNDRDLETAMIRRCGDIPRTVKDCVCARGGKASVAVMPAGPLTVPFISV